ncbi:MAG: VWA domain-containing protein, partial [Candidatus Eremiobacteraeota bacterium]|nr:VWA domain-containing protein [Candidatus Eremiobacteraeota bacterium]
MSKDLKDPAAAQTPVPTSSKPEIAAFLDRVKALSPTSVQGQRGRLIFALDATMSRQPTWDTACALQADMFREAARAGGLDIQLVYFRGLNECRASGWVASGEKLATLMGRISCMGGHTQIGKVLAH